MATHAYLSPSASHRWLHCTAAPGLEGAMPDKGSIYAEEGTLAHAICEAKLRAYVENRVDGKGRYPMAIYAEEHGMLWTEDELYKEEMEDTSDYYVQIVTDLYEEALKETPDARLLIEKKVTVTDKLFGTADALIIADGLCNVIDYKHGKGVEVSADHNPQMMIYAYGAFLWFTEEYDISEITMTIVQPRIHNTTSWNTPITDLVRWARDVLMPTAVSIVKGEELHQEPGEWCKFCKVKARCKALAEMATKASGITATGEVTKQTNYDLLSLTEVAKLLTVTGVIKSWCEAVEEYALGKALGGANVPGYKIVEGRSIRKIRDAEGMVRLMEENGVDTSLVWKPRELQTLSSLEKIIGKKEFAVRYGQFVEKPKGKPTLVPETDKRPVYQRDSIEDEFGDISD